MFCNTERKQTNFIKRAICQLDPAAKPVRFPVVYELDMCKFILLNFIWGHVFWHNRLEWYEQLKTLVKVFSSRTELHLVSRPFEVQYRNYLKSNINGKKPPGVLLQEDLLKKLDKEWLRCQDQQILTRASGLEQTQPAKEQARVIRCYHKKLVRIHLSTKNLRSFFT